MAGVVGIVSLNPGQEPPSRILDEMVRHYRQLRGSAVDHRFAAGGRAKVALVDGAVTGSLTQTERGWSATVGRASPTGGSGEGRIGDLDGHFAAVRYDAVKDRLEVFNDPFGTLNLYVAEAKRFLYFSTSATLLARQLSAEPHPLGARLFLRSGYHMGPVTHWRGVRRLEPATVMTFEAAGHREDEYWRPHVREELHRLDFDELTERSVSAGITAVRAHLGSDPRVSADLTGGFDSRMTCLLLDRAGVEFEAVTVGEPDEIDVVLARRTAEIGGYAWRNERGNADWELSGDDLRHAAAWSDGALDVLPLSRVLWQIDRRRDAAAAVVTGGGGEHFGPFPWLQEFVRAGRSRQVNFENLMRMRVLVPFDVSILREDPNSEVEAYCRDRLEAHARPYAHLPNTIQLDSMYAYKSVGHFGAYRSAIEAHVRQELPCYYRDFFETAFSAHYRWRNGNRLHRGIIERLDPAVAAVATTHGGPATRMRLATVPQFAPYFFGLSRTAVRKLANRPAPPTVLSCNIVGQYRRVTRQLIEDRVLQPDAMHTADLYKPSELRQLLSASQEDGFTQWPLLGRVMTLELAVRAADETGG